MRLDASARTPTVEDTTGISEGQRIVLALRDETGTLGLAMHNGRAEAGTCEWQQPLTHEWPVTVTAVSDGVESRPTTTPSR